MGMNKNFSLQNVPKHVEIFAKKSKKFFYNNKVEKKFKKIYNKKVKKSKKFFIII